MLRRRPLSLAALRQALHRFAVTRRHLQTQDAALVTAIGFGPALAAAEGRLRAAFNFAGLAQERTSTLPASQSATSVMAMAP